MSSISNYQKQIQLEFYQRVFKHCNKCNTTRPIFMFTPKQGNRLNLNVFCKPCRTLIEIAKRAKLSYNELSILYKKYDNKCAICYTNDSNRYHNPAVDHDHKTGKIRGILCTNCNLALGLFKDNIKVLETAILYLKGKTQ